MTDIIDLRDKVKKFIYLVESFFPLKQEQKIHQPGIIFWPPKFNFLSYGLLLTCESLTHSDVRNCNLRVVKGILGKASEGFGTL